MYSSWGESSMPGKHEGVLLSRYNLLVASMTTGVTISPVTKKVQSVP